MTCTAERAEPHLRDASLSVGVLSRGCRLAAVITALAAYMHWTGFGSRIGHDAVLRFQMLDDEEGDGSLRTVLRRYCQRFSLMHLREGNEGDPVEFTYQVKLLEPGYSRGLVAEMQDLESVRGITLHLQGEDVEI